MALETEVNLKLLLTAQNDAADILTELTTQVTDATAAFKELADTSLGTLSDQLDGMVASVSTLADKMPTVADVLKTLGDTSVDGAAFEGLTAQMTTLAADAEKVQATLADLGTGTAKSVEIETLNAQLTTAADRADATTAAVRATLDAQGTSPAVAELNAQLTTADDRLTLLRTALVSVLDQAGTSKALADLNAQLTTVQTRLETDQAGLEAILKVTGEVPALTDLQDQLLTASEKTTALADALATVQTTGGPSADLTDWEAQLTTLQTEAQQLRMDLAEASQLSLGAGGSKGASLTGSAAAPLADVGLTSALTSLQATGPALERDAEAIAQVQAALDAATVDTQSFWQRVQGWVLQATDALSGLAEKTDTLGAAGAAGTSGGHFSMMGAGMTAMMAYMGTQMLANGANEFSTIQQMQLAMKSTPNQAAHMAEMLGTGGITGASAATFLTGLAANIQNALKPINGTMGREGVMLQSLGIGQAQANQSPQYLLQAIQQGYMRYVHQGLGGTSGAQLLQLTGTSQLAGVFAHWSSLQHQASTTHLGMTTKQVDQAAQQGLSLQMSLQQLTLAFDQMAVSLVPLLNPLIHGLTAFLQVIDQVVQGLTTSTTTKAYAHAFQSGHASALPTHQLSANPLLDLGHLFQAQMGQVQSYFHASTWTTELQSLKAAWKMPWLGKLGSSIANTLQKDGSTAHSALTQFAQQALTDVTHAFHQVQGKVLTPLTHWAQQALTDFKAALHRTWASLSQPLTNWAQHAVSHLTNALKATWKDLTAPLTNWASQLVTNLGTALHNISSQAASAFTLLGTEVSLQLQSAIDSMLAAGEQAVAGALNHVPGHQVIGGTIQGIHHASTANTEMAKLATAHSELLSVLSARLGSNLASRASASGLANHGTVININIQGLTGSARATAQQVADQIVQQLKLQGNFGF